MRWLYCLLSVFLVVPLHNTATFAKPTVKIMLQTPLAKARYRAWVETVVLRTDYEIRLRTAPSDVTPPTCPCNGTKVYKPDGRVVVQCPCFASGKQCTCRPAGAPALDPTDLPPDLPPVPQLEPLPPVSTNTELADKLAALSQELAIDVVSPSFALAADGGPVNAYYCTSNTCSACQETTRWINHLAKDVGNGWTSEDIENDKPANIILAQIRGNRTPRAAAFQGKHMITLYPTWLFVQNGAVLERYDGNAALQLSRTDVLNKLVALNQPKQQPAMAGPPAAGFGPSTWFTHDAPGTKPYVEQVLATLQQILGSDGEIRVQLKPRAATALVSVLLSDTTGLRITSSPQLAANVVFDGKTIKVKFTDGRVQAYWRGVSGDIPGFQIDTQEILVPISGIAPDQVFRVLP